MNLFTRTLCAFSRAHASTSLETVPDSSRAAASRGHAFAPFMFTQAMLLRVLLWLLAVAPLSAATFTVTNGNDSGAGSLRQAMLDARFNGQVDTIDFDAGLNGGTIFISGSALASGSLEGLTIDASALSQGITLRRSGSGALFDENGVLTLRSLTLTGGTGTALSDGGAITNGGTMTLERCTLSGNSAIQGGAISNFRQLTLRQCTIAGNTASWDGAAIISYQGSVSLIHCTVFGNSTRAIGSGIYNFNGSALVIENSIVAASRGAEGYDIFNGGAATLNGANIVPGVIGGNGASVSGTVSYVDPQLAPLGNYGGPTQTLIPLSGSPAIDAAVGSVETIDQRGRLRPIDGDLNGLAVADIGAVEFASTNANLASLALSEGTLTPAFDGAQIDYTASVSNATTSITVTPTRGHPVATITVNGSSVASGSASGAIVLSVGVNNITTVVTAEDGMTTKTYTVAVTRLSTDANLAGLALSAGTLAPPFGSGTPSYTATVPFEVDRVTATPTAANSGATITVNGNAVASGSASGSIALNVGMNAITTVVTSQDGSVMKTYTVALTRQANANLASLTVSAGALRPGFASGTLSYTVVASSTSVTTTITPTVADANATITVNGSAVASGNASGEIALSVGNNTITTVVTAQDGTPKTYTVNVIIPYLVSVAGNSGAGSLRQAVLDAEAHPGADMIVFDPALSGQTINLTNSDLTNSTVFVASTDG